MANASIKVLRILLRNPSVKNTRFVGKSGRSFRVQGISRSKVVGRIRIHDVAALSRWMAALGNDLTPAENDKHRSSWDTWVSLLARFCEPRGFRVGVFIVRPRWE